MSPPRPPEADSLSFANALHRLLQRSNLANRLSKGVSVLPRLGGNRSISCCGARVRLFHAIVMSRPCNRRALRLNRRRTKARAPKGGGRAMYTLYSMRRSGNCYKVRLALAQLGIAYELVEVDILKGESRTPEFLAKNPSGQVPLLEVAPGRYIAGIERDPLVPRRRNAAAAGGSDRPRRNAAMDVLRAAQPRAQSRRRLFLAGAGQGRARTAAARARGLDGGGLPRARRDGEAPRQAASSLPPTATPSPTSRSTPTPTWRTSATTTSRAFPAVRDWLDRVAAQPGHVAMDWHPAESLAAAQ